MRIRTVPVPSPPPAGTSALAGADEARARRRRALVRTPVLALAALAAGLGAALGPVAGVFGAHDTRGRVALAVGGLVGAYLAWRGRPRPDPDRWARGAAGEAATAALLRHLGRRWVVRHDLAVPGSRANLDHVVIGPTGVWVIDSKAYRAPLQAGWRSVRAGDRPLDTASVAWEAQVVADRLGVIVRPLVAVHGRGLPERGRKVDGVRVVPAAAVVARLRRGTWSWWCRPGARHLGPPAVTALAAEFDATFGPAAWQDARPGRHAGRGRERLR